MHKRQARTHFLPPVKGLFEGDGLLGLSSTAGAGFDALLRTNRARLQESLQLNSIASDEERQERQEHPHVPTCLKLLEPPLNDVWSSSGKLAALSATTLSILLERTS